MGMTGAFLGFGTGIYGAVCFGNAAELLCGGRIYRPAVRHL